MAQGKTQHFKNKILHQMEAQHATASKKGVVVLKDWLITKLGGYTEADMQAVLRNLNKEAEKAKEAEMQLAELGVARGEYLSACHMQPFKGTYSETKAAAVVTLEEKFVEKMRKEFWPRAHKKYTFCDNGSCYAYATVFVAEPEAEQEESNGD